MTYATWRKSHPRRYDTRPQNYTAFSNERRRVLAEIEEALKQPQRAEVLRRVARMLTMKPKTEHRTSNIEH